MGGSLSTDKQSKNLSRKAPTPTPLTTTYTHTFREFKLSIFQSLTRIFI